MTGPRRYILRMAAFLIGVIAVVVLLIGPISRAFMANPALNGLILFALIIGIGYSFRQVLMLGREVYWLEMFQRAERTSTIAPPDPPTLLAPMAKMLERRGGRTSLSSVATRSLLDSIGSRLDESRDISRYITGLLIFLGLLGTFWGLLETVSSVGETIGGLSVGSGDFVQLFDNLKRGLESPLGGMGTAFSSSLFGLSGSLVLGFLDLQAGQAQNRFYNELEEWLSGITRLSSGGSFDGEASVPAYVEALLEQTAESLDNLQRIMTRSEDSRANSGAALHQLADRLAVLTDMMRSEQELLVRLTENQLELRPVLARLAQQGEVGGLDTASRNHLRNIDVYVTRLLEESAEGRNRMIEDVRGEIKLLARTIAAAADDRRRVN